MLETGLSGDLEVVSVEPASVPLFKLCLVGDLSKSLASGLPPHLSSELLRLLTESVTEGALAGVSGPGGLRRACF